MDKLELPLDFVDNFIFKAQPEYAMVYLYAYRQKLDEASVNAQQIEKALGIKPDVVLKAIEYWKGKGYDIFSQKPLAPICDKSKYSPSEITKFMENDTELAVLYEEVSRIMGKALSTNDINTLFWIYNDLGFSSSVIIMLVNYAKKEDKCRMRFIEATAQQWSEKGIATFEDAEKHLAEIENKNNYEQRIKKLFGIFDRSFTSTEKEIINSWHNEIKPTKKELEYAYEVCVEKTGKFSVKYINAVLVNQKKDKKPKAENMPTPKATKFKNFTQNGDVDYRELEKLAIKKRMSKTMKGDETDE